MHYVKAALFLLAVFVGVGLMFLWIGFWFNFSKGALWGLAPALSPFFLIAFIAFAQVFK